MFGKRRRERLKENAASASALALALAQDKRFRKRFFSAIGHGAEAGRRTRRGLGLGSAVARLASDPALMRELKSARSDLQQAYGRLEAKRRSHRRRKLLMLVGLSTLAGLPHVRARLLRTLSRVSTRYSLPGATRLATSGRANFPRPNRLEDLTKEDLYARAQDADIPGRSEMSKNELIEALRARS